MDLTPQLVMVRHDLDALPDIVLPDGFVIRTYQDGDASGWEQVVSTAFDRPFDFAETMAGDGVDLSRIGLIWHGDVAVATASAWERERWDAVLGQGTGYVHYVATLPGYGGKGLGSAISLWTLHAFVKMGKKRAVLQTDDMRIPAIAVYLKLGFRPLVIDENQYARWQSIFAQLNAPQEMIEEMQAQPVLPIQL